MKDLAFWKFVAGKMHQHEPVVLICVLESSGSSPGRRGFKMAVTPADLYGSIGGGIMEHKFAELARNIISEQQSSVMLKKQVHHKHSRYQSGMICSGEQTVAVYHLNADDLNAVSMIVNALETGSGISFMISAGGIEASADIQAEGLERSDEYWQYTEVLGQRNRLYIIGGGHVSLAFSRLMRGMDYHITVFDDRNDLNTMEQNVYADEKHIASYEHIEDHIPEGNVFVVIMTFGYRTDDIVLRRLIGRDYFYLGLLGSKAKISKMKNDLLNDGYDQMLIDRVHAPVGLQINSRTPEEIAVSIAAEIISVKNKSL